ncbi:hypothetical protein HOLleu_40379 [Holothuria leucospilota]|uniref:Immunoglobulin V-set domain-containing protein n=1 Tax=Holothuria leucospilota TaxID=206669 RepID=A0A9Q0YKY5_HOLLE|nr:hypothetical protein HOLleu_40379 [Holothuria leucospilota]
MKVELGSDVIISCDMNNLQDVYWFRGSTLTTSPILLLEGDNKGGTEYGNGQFHIYANGSMGITGVRLEHEGSYNVVAYFTDGSSGESSVNVTITDVYWFRGSSLRTSPILRLEGDNKGGTEYGNGQFDIYANGSMGITAVRLEHEGSYNVVVYFTDGSSGESSVNVTITGWLNELL